MYISMCVHMYIYIYIYVYVYATTFSEMVSGCKFLVTSRNVCTKYGLATNSRTAACVQVCVCVAVCVGVCIGVCLCVCLYYSHASRYYSRNLSTDKMENTLHTTDNNRKRPPKLTSLCVLRLGRTILRVPFAVSNRDMQL